MAITTATPNRSNQALQTGSVTALNIEEFNGMVETKAREMSVLEGWISPVTLKGTNVATKKAIGPGSFQALVPGESPNGIATDLNKIQCTVRNAGIWRSIIAKIDEWQTDFDFRAKLAAEAGKDLADLRDQSLMNLLTRAALATTNPYGVTGFAPATQETLVTAGDETDPQKLYDGLVALAKNMRKKKVDLSKEGGCIFMRSDEFYTLIQNELLINSDYKTANGTKVENGFVLSMYGVPVKCTENLPSGVVSGHLFGADFNGDFSDVIAIAACEKAVFTAQHFWGESEVFVNPLDKCTYVDVVASLGGTLDRVEYAGALLKA